MKFIHRLGYYLGGFSIGLIFLAFFLSGKRTSCSYGPNARVLKNIGIKELKYAADAETFIALGRIDSTTIATVLKEGNVNFSLSETELDSCKVYVIEDEINDQKIVLSVENCDSIATLKTIVIK